MKKNFKSITRLVFLCWLGFNLTTGGKHMDSQIKWATEVLGHVGEAFGKQTGHAAARLGR